MRSRLKRIRRRITRSGPFVGFLASAASVFLRLYARTLRIETRVDPECAALDPAKVLYAFWHGRQFLLVPSFRHRGIVVMTDLSWAGEIQTGIMTRLGYPVVRGASGRRATMALLMLRRAIEEGHSAAFALDGPRGPIHKSKPGILYLAGKLGYPIVPVATSASRALIIPNTWCRYLLPAPFSRCRVALGKPIREAAEAALTNDELDRVIAAWTAETDRAVGREPSNGS